MTPNDLEAYLQVFARNNISMGAIKLPEGVEVHFTFMPPLPLAGGTEPTPGGWKSPDHLDDVSALRDDREYKGDLPT